jgi:hypothetical protein
MRLPLVFFVSIVLSSPALAQAPKIRDESMLQIQRLALANIHTARCGADRCAPATEEEKRNLPLSLAEMRQVFDRAAFSGVALVCRIDWNTRNYKPMMAYWRTQMKNERQLALISVIHGLVMSEVNNNFRGGKSCSPEMKNDVETKIDFKP